MRGLLSLAAVAALAAISSAQGWVLKAPYDAKTKLTYKVVVVANMGGQEHEASMNQNVVFASKSDKDFKAKASWTDLKVDGNEMPNDDDGWEIVLNPNGSISSAGDNADFVRMLAPATFIYPDKEVKAGDKWTAKFKPEKDGKDITVDYEVLAQEKVGDVDALKVKGKLADQGSDFKSDGTYWLGKDGKVLKFDLNVTNWSVPMAGSGAFDAKIKGELAKS